MIARRTDPGLVHLITQPDHAALARRVMEAWRPLDGHPRREIILWAIGAHDDGWREEDAAPMVDHSTGRLADFVHLPVDRRQGVWPRGVTRAAAMHPWAGALIAHHASYVYQRYRPDPAWASFFAETEAMEATLAAASGFAAEAMPRDYDFLRLGDLISLAFCACWTDEQQHAGFRVRPSGDGLTITPDVFDGAEVALSIAARVLADVPYSSDEALREALGAAPVTTISGAARGLTAT